MLLLLKPTAGQLLVKPTVLQAAHHVVLPLSMPTAMVTHAAVVALTVAAALTLEAQETVNGETVNTSQVQPTPDLSENFSACQKMVPSKPQND